MSDTTGGVISARLLFHRVVPVLLDLALRKLSCAIAVQCGDCLRLLLVFGVGIEQVQVIDSDSRVIPSPITIQVMRKSRNERHEKNSQPKAKNTA